MQASKSFIQFATHAVHITVTEDSHIRVFKHSDRCCDFGVFTDQDEACDYILELMPTTHYKVTFPEEDE
jgi:hypothetical protein